MTTDLRPSGRIALLIAAFLLVASGSSMAQTTAPAANTGAIKLTAGFDVPSLYYFRGIRQEADPRITMWPYGDVGITFRSADKGLKSVAVNFGVWNSLHTGSVGSKSAPGRSTHYKEDFYSTLTLGFSAISASTKYIAYTSPNESYNTTKEIDLQVTGTQKFTPYGLVAIELNETTAGHTVGADGGQKKGTYLEFGATPSWPFGKSSVTLAIPVSVGLSLKDYYEGVKGDSKFGFVDVGGLLTVPFSKEPGKFGSWNVHARGDYFGFGDTTKAFNKHSNKDKSSGFVAMGGIGFSY